MIAVIDTNVIVDNPFFFNLIKNTKIVLPMVVLEELDKLKSQEGIVGKNCRTFIHNLRFIIDNGRKQDSNVFAFMDIILGLSSNDNIIIASAEKLMVKHANVVLYTNDINMQIKALAKKIVAKSFVFEPEQNVYDKSYIDIEIDSSSDLYKLKNNQQVLQHSIDRQYVLVNNDIPAKVYRNVLSRIPSMDDGIMGLKAKNIEQTFALDALLDDNIKLVSLIGVAGTGKTLLAIATALFKTLDDSKYDNIIISRPTVSMGKDLGFLPGELNEKLMPWMMPFFDNIDFLMGDNDKVGTAQRLIDTGVIKIESLSHIRGRSFANKYIIIDEAQNLDKHELKTLISRAAEGTKIVLTGDVYQIDTKGLDISNNGLSYVTEKFQGQDIFANVTLTKSERSKLSELAGKLL